MSPIHVMVVDDSATMRQVLSEVLAREPDIEVIATAVDPLFALEKMARRWPDVIVLDLEMPRMDGLTFLRKLMAERPTPVVICSALTERGAEATVHALAAGAVSVVCKPTIGLREFLEHAGSEIAEAVRAAAQATLRCDSRPSARPRVGGSVEVPPLAAARIQPRPLPGTWLCAERLVALGASTGGTQALERVLTALPVDSPGVVVVQHMPERFTAAFARRLDGLSAIEVREAQGGEEIRPGLALIAPGGRHMLVRRSGAHYRVEVMATPPVNRHRPSVDVLFQSIARCAGPRTLAALLTGMGDDGARGLKELRNAGARTYAQDEASCVVYGMPKEAVRLGAVERSVTPAVLADEIARFAHG